MTSTSTSFETAERYHDISCGHRVYNHESKCAYLHGHNYRFTFTCLAPSLDQIGRVIDFSVIKARLAMWLEEHWDHHFLVWQEDPWARELSLIDPTVVQVPFNPTAENLAKAFLTVIGPKQLEGTDVTLIKVRVDETRKCWATSSLMPKSLASIINPGPLVGAGDGQTRTL